MGTYRDNLSVIVIGDNFLPIIVIAQNSFNLSITDIAFVKYFSIADKSSRQTIVYAHSVKLASIGAMEKIHGPREVLLQLNKIFLCFVWCHGRVRELLYFLEKSRKHFCDWTYKKKTSSNTWKIYRNIHRKNLSAIIYRLPVSL